MTTITIKRTRYCKCDIPKQEKRNKTYICNCLESKINQLCFCGKLNELKQIKIDQKIQFHFLDHCIQKKYINIIQHMIPHKNVYISQWDDNIQQYTKYNRNIDVFKLLHQKGYHVLNKKTMFYAIYHNYVYIVKYMLEHAFDVNQTIPNDRDKTKYPIEWVCEYQSDHVQMIHIVAKNTNFLQNRINIKHDIVKIYIDFEENLLNLLHQKIVNKKEKMALLMHQYHQFLNYQDQYNQVIEEMKLIPGGEEYRKALNEFNEFIKKRQEITISKLT